MSNEISVTFNLNLHIEIPAGQEIKGRSLIISLSISAVNSAIVTASNLIDGRRLDLYFSEEAHADILAWTGGGVLGHGPVRNQTVEKINWKQEGF